ncbi:hypothetical protein BGHDH14_bgh01035 [Blumeria hordei DH14]|uniref:Thioesterase domain-containing protein n=1 Tax=Blumeria graminis f. sp. hordei (strain DH14) TaxID=546991 RepID=N1JM07_BLUG1|nr:hypothetical protein BGHDH14_bgh01035 [Blumeria hordei DH14]
MKMPAHRFVQSVLNSIKAESGLETRLFGDHLRLVAVKPGEVHIELDIKKEHTNRLRTVHGGVIASMVDVGGSLAVASRGLFATGVSTDLNGWVFWRCFESDSKMRQTNLQLVRHWLSLRWNLRILRGNWLLAEVTPNMFVELGAIPTISWRN